MAGRIRVKYLWKCRMMCEITLHHHHSTPWLFQLYMKKLSLPSSPSGSTSTPLDAQVPISMPNKFTNPGGSTINHTQQILKFTLLWLLDLSHCLCVGTFCCHFSSLFFQYSFIFLESSSFFLFNVYRLPLIGWRPCSCA